MSSQLSTFVNTDGAVVLVWGLTEDGETTNRAVALTPEAAEGLGRALVARSHKAREVQDLFTSITSLLADIDPETV